MEGWSDGWMEGSGIDCVLHSKKEKEEEEETISAPAVTDDDDAIVDSALFRMPG